MDKIPSVLVATTQAAGGIAAQFVGPEIYGGDADWKSILASHGAGFVVGVLVNFMAYKYPNTMNLGHGPVVRGYNLPTYPIMGWANETGTVSIVVDQGLQWLASVVVLAVMRRNTRTFLMDLAASTVGQGIGGFGGAYATANKDPLAAKLLVEAYRKTKDAKQISQ